MRTEVGTHLFRSPDRNPEVYSRKMQDEGEGDICAHRGAATITRQNWYGAGRESTRSILLKKRGK